MSWAYFRNLCCSPLTFFKGFCRHKHVKGVIDHKHSSDPSFETGTNPKGVIRQAETKMSLSNCFVNVLTIIFFAVRVFRIQIIKLVF